jgi:hypothetical protein
MKSLDDNSYQMCHFVNRGKKMVLKSDKTTFGIFTNPAPRCSLS